MAVVHHNKLGSQLTTLAVGGPVAQVIDVESENELLSALNQHPDAVCIGGGSNLLISDDGYNGLLICNVGSSSGIHISGSTVRVEAAVNWDEFVKISVGNGLQGVEATSGVPGSFGGAVVQNLGAYGQEIADVIVNVNVWDAQTKSARCLSKQECGFTYRSSIFKHDGSRRYVVTSAELQLQPAGTSIPRYGDVSQLLLERHGNEGPYPLAEIRDAVLEVRKSKGMLLGASLPSAGSFFTNPILTESQAQTLAEQGFKVVTRSDGTRLTSAAALMQAAGYERGYRLGNAGLSDLHVLALVNAGGATASEIVELAKRIRNDVQEKFGVRLIPEPVTLGFDVDPFL